MSLIDSLKTAFEKARHKRDALEAIVKSLMVLRTQYFTDNKNIPKNVLVQLYNNIDMAMESLLRIKPPCLLHWISKRGREKLSIALMVAIDDESIDSAKAVQFIGKMEQVMYPVIDSANLVGHFLAQEGFQFAFMIQENFKSTDYIRTMLQCQAKYWEFLRHQIRYQSQIQATIYVGKLMPPSSCMLTVQFIFQLQEIFELKYCRINYIANCLNKQTNQSSTSIVDRKLTKRAFENVFCVPFYLTKGRSPSFPDMIVLENKYFKLELAPLAGLTYNLEISDEDQFITWNTATKYPMLEMKCSIIHPDVGIPFMVNYVSKENNN